MFMKNREYQVVKLPLEEMGVGKDRAPSLPAAFIERILDY